jgi:hypothetical protein
MGESKTVKPAWRCGLKASGCPILGWVINQVGALMQDKRWSVFPRGLDRCRRADLAELNLDALHRLGEVVHTTAATRLRLPAGGAWQTVWLP